MTVKEFYDKTGGGYETMKDKFSSDAMITAFLKLLKKDKSYENLCAQLEAGDVKEAFAAAHTLKGVVLNLNLVGLIDPVVAVTEELRAGNLEGGRALFPRVEKAYALTVAALDEVLA